MKEKLKDLYCLYQFRLEKETERCLVFGYRMGFFRNIEIVILKNKSEHKKEAKVLEREYHDAGWDNVNVEFYHAIEDAEKKLFESFFYIQDSRQRLYGEYKNFCESQTRKHQSDYTYVLCRYSNAEEKVATNLVHHIAESAANHTARLTILEAAAGYGKTCTVYEILHRLLEDYPEKIPLFIELSKNRMANIFLYVLQNEINEKFTQLSTELVIREVKAGKMPLIIDGFDELIQWKKSVEKEDNLNEQSLSMLSTIADLLGEDSKAWILLTSRRSAIFTGDIFEEWVSTKLGKECRVERVQILKPSAKEWIGDEKYYCMCRNHIAIDSISNPVLLTLVHKQSLTEVEEMVKDEDAVILKYFNMLLAREETRQILNLSPEKLYCVMERLASLFVQYDIMAESREFIEELLYEILQEDLMSYRVSYREKYGSEVGMLSREDYIGRILNNSLLDRISTTSNQIGFINEFVMGVLIGDAVCNHWLQAEDLSESFIDISTTAFLSRGQKKGREYYEQIKTVLGNVGGQTRLNAEMNLLHKNESNYENEYFSGVYFQNNYEFDSNFKFRDCTFSSCIFDQCVIQADVFENVRFFNCQFFEIQVQGVMNDNVFLGCTGYELLKKKTEVETVVKETADKYEKIILEQFWKPGYQAAEPRRTYTAMFKGIDSSKYHNIEVALKALLKKGLLKELNVCYELNLSKINEIKEILGR